MVINATQCSFIISLNSILLIRNPSWDISSKCRCCFNMLYERYSVVRLLLFPQFIQMNWFISVSNVSFPVRLFLLSAPVSGASQNRNTSVVVCQLDGGNRMKMLILKQWMNHEPAAVCAVAESCLTSSYSIMKLESIIQWWILMTHKIYCQSAS